MTYSKKQLKRLRQHHDLDQKSMAKIMGVGQAAYSRIESSDDRSLTKRHVERLSDYFGVDPSYFEEKNGMSVAELLDSCDIITKLEGKQPLPLERGQTVLASKVTGEINTGQLHLISTEDGIIATSVLGKQNDTVLTKSATYNLKECNYIAEIKAAITIF